MRHRERESVCLCVNWREREREREKERERMREIKWESDRMSGRMRETVGEKVSTVTELRYEGYSSFCPKSSICRRNCVNIA